MKASRHYGLAYIEIVICIAMVGMLTALAVPRFMRAQTSSQVARVRSDMRHISIALENYKIDRGSYPKMIATYNALRTGWRVHGTDIPTLERLTTPVAYAMSGRFTDPFEPTNIYTSTTLDQVITPDWVGLQKANSFYYYGARNYRDNAVWHQTAAHDIDPVCYLLESSGPDRHHHYLWPALNGMTTDTLETRGFLGKTIYDPTNGTTSRGSIWRLGGSPIGHGKSMAEMVKTATNPEGAE